MTSHCIIEPTAIWSSRQDTSHCREADTQANCGRVINPPYLPRFLHSAMHASASVFVERGFELSIYYASTHPIAQERVRCHFYPLHHPDNQPYSRLQTSASFGDRCVRSLLPLSAAWNRLHGEDSYSILSALRSRTDPMWNAGIAYFLQPSNASM